MFLLLCNLTAWAALILGMGRAAAGFYVGSIDAAVERAAAADRYLGSATAGQAVQEGIFLFVFGVVLDLLVKIAKGLATRPR